ncbi:hypothetical protein ISG33_13625 [Glaciecola sp. MH2013]|uniref:hypothetical protein n=1 Tax=Glaciecola sp. MH2013 TaxID=2785524 RepID=UPI00189D143E|nr:hypothetical protein [Glaciecola sp. MH2013]MBF7074441.1 hypothetical protein [Glaciecola sp. MH2013]
MDFNNSVSIAAGSGIVTMFILFTTIVIHILFAMGVYSAAKQGEIEGSKTWFIWPIDWSFAVLVLGPFFAGIYWIIHHSTLGGFDESAIERIRSRRRQINNES